MITENTNNSNDQTQIVATAPTENDELVPIIPLKDVVLFPNMVAPLFIGRQKSVVALEAAARKDNMVILLSQKNPDDNDITPDNIYDVGTLTKILQVLKLPDGTSKVLLEGKVRAKAISIIETNGYLACNVKTLITKNDINKIESEAIRREVIGKFDEFANLSQKVPEEIVNLIAKVEDIEQLTDIITAHTISDITTRQELLEIPSMKKRLNKLLRE